VIGSVLKPILEGRRIHKQRLFPNTSYTALAELDAETEHRFKKPELLAEALTHCSAQTRAVKANDHLAYVGEVIMCAYATDKAIHDAGFFNSNLHISIKESDVLGYSFCMPAGTEKSSPLSEYNSSQNALVKNALVTSLERRIKVCCNHVSYAASCIKTNMQVNMTCGSPERPSVQELQDNISRFQKKMSCEQTTTKWKQLFRAGAPKALGDLFLAVIGAITMDADTSEAHAMIKKHYTYSQEIFDIMETGIPDHRILSVHDPTCDRELSAESIQQLLRDAPKLAICSRLSAAGEWVDADMVKRCNDICVLQVPNTKKTLWLGTSPRSLLVHIALEEQRVTPRSDSDEETESIENNESQAAEDEGQVHEHQGAIYCKHCMMWLNGPTQWADHEIGKKHRKAVRMHARNKNDDAENLILPPIPEGFGKRPLPYRDGMDDTRRAADDQRQRDSSTDHMDGWNGASNAQDKKANEQSDQHPRFVDFFDEETCQWRAGLVYPVLPNYPAALPRAMQ
jgi:hypothetical protein